jgi:hypothetical protein
MKPSFQEMTNESNVIFANFPKSTTPSLVDEAIMSEVKDSLENLRNGLIEDYLDCHCSLVEEEYFGYDGCTYIKKVWSESDYQDAVEFANEQLKEALKQLIQ